MMLLGKEERKVEKLMIRVVKNKTQTWLSSSRVPLAFHRGFEGDSIIQRDWPVQVRSRCGNEGSALRWGRGRQGPAFPHRFVCPAVGWGSSGTPGPLQSPSTHRLLPPRLHRRRRRQRFALGSARQEALLLPCPPAHSFANFQRLPRRRY